MKLKSFGCSFIYGSELSSRDHTWPARIADRLGLQHQNYGLEGAGNLRILHEIMNHARPNDKVIVQWTWIDRFDYISVLDEHWQTITPSDTDVRSMMYYRDLHSQYKDMFSNLLYIKSAINFLQSRNISFFMTYIDKLLIERVLPEWHSGPAVQQLQHDILSYLNGFRGMTFLDFSRSNGYPETSRWHPLDAAHAAAADLIFEDVKHTFSIKDNAWQNAF